jgi:hypothetical protein
LKIKSRWRKRRSFYYFLYLRVGYVFCGIKKIYGSSLLHYVFEFHDAPPDVLSDNVLAIVCPTPSAEADTSACGG